MREFSQIFNELKKKTGLTNEHMAKLLNLSLDAVEALETQYMQPAMDIMLRMADIFHVSLAYIAGSTADPTVSEDLSVKEIFVVNGFTGPGNTVSKRDIEGSVFIDKETTHGKDFLAYTAYDDSMCKCRMFKGDILIVRRQSYADNGDVVIAVVDGEKEIVRRYRRNGNIVTLSAEGDGIKYPTLKIDERESHLKILGKVYEVRIKI